MFPSLSFNNPAYLRVSGIKYSGDINVSNSAFAQSPDFYNLSLCEFGRWMTIALKGAMSAFSHFVSIVVGYCSYKQMSGIAANSIVTSVADKHTLWYNSIYRLPRQSMSFHMLAIYLSRSISVVCNSFKPWPALIVTPLINKEPKVILNLNGSRVVGRPMPSHSIVMSPTILSVFTGLITALTNTFSHHMAMVAHTMREVNLNLKEI